MHCFCMYVSFNHNQHLNLIGLLFSLYQELWTEQIGEKQRGKTILSRRAIFFSFNRPPRQMFVPAIYSADNQLCIHLDGEHELNLASAFAPRMGC